MKNSYLFFAIIALALFMGGCKKESAVHPDVPLLAQKVNSLKNDSLVLTPGGWLPKSHVFLVEKGYNLLIQDGHVLKIHTATGKVMSDFGKIKDAQINNKKNSSTRNLNSSIVPGDDGWVTDAVWSSSPGSPINYFSTNWVVPDPPINTINNPVIFIFNALSQVQGGGDIMQPVLQWGGSATGGGNYWGIANWYGWSSNQYFAFTNLITVTSGTHLQGIITSTGTKSDGSYNYTVGFSGYTNLLSISEGSSHSGTIGTTPGTVTFPYISQELWAFETLETYNGVNYNSGNGAASSTDYPGQLNVPMTNIKLLTNSTPASLNWTPQIGDYATTGEHTNVISNNSSGSGEVDIYFHQPPPPPPFGVYYINSRNLVYGIKLTSTSNPSQTVNSVLLPSGGNTQSFSPNLPSGYYNITLLPSAGYPTTTYLVNNTGGTISSTPVTINNVYLSINSGSYTTAQITIR